MSRGCICYNFYNLATIKFYIYNFLQQGVFSPSIISLPFPSLSPLFFFSLPLNQAPMVEMWPIGVGLMGLMWQMWQIRVGELKGLMLQMWQIEVVMDWWVVLVVGHFWLGGSVGFNFSGCGFCGLLVVVWVVQEWWGGEFGRGDDAKVVMERNYDIQFSI